MKVMQINRDSWHFKLASKLGGLDVEIHDDFCSYTRRVLLSFLSVAALAVAASAATYLVVSGVFFLYLLATLGHFPKEGWYALGVVFDGILLAAAALIGLVALIGYVLGKRKERQRELRYQQRIADQAYFEEHGCYPEREVKTSFVKEAYASFKEKTCYRLNVN